ncbi:MAG: hypothetical protein JXA30_13260 [Deltaproteobacteria bacterium]|nr:hypothetical protein [Deltaproteobacteria bacterium]
MSARCFISSVLFFLILLAYGCGERDDLAIPVDLMQPLALGPKVVFIDKSLYKAYLLDVTKKEIEPKVTAADLPPRPLLVQKRNQVDELLILCAGQQDTEGKEEKPAALAVLKSDGGVRKYEIERGFNSLIQSQDGRYVFLSVQGQTEDDPTATNTIVLPQNVMFIDLEKKPSDESARFSLLLGNSISNVPTGVSFSPEMSVAGKSRRLALIQSTDIVWLVDLSTPDSPPIFIQPNVGQQFSFEQALFDEKKKRLFLRGSNTDTINILDFAEDTDASSATDMLPLPVLRDPRLVAQGPSDMALYTVGDRTYLLVVSNGSNVATIIDTDSSTVATVALPVVANRILMFSSTAASESEAPSAQALLYNHGGQYNVVTFIDLANIDLEGTERLKAESVESVYFDTYFDQLSVVPNGNIVVLINTNGKQVSLLDLAERNVFPIKTPSQMKVIADSRVNKLWFEPRTNDQNNDRLVYLDLETFSSEDVRLDSQIEHALLVGTEAEAQIAIVHPSSIGYVTVLDAKSPSRKSAVSVEGFFISHVLDRGEP